MQAVTALAIVRSYDDLHLALRQRADGLQFSRTILDEGVSDDQVALAACEAR